MEISEEGGNDPCKPCLVRENSSPIERLSTASPYLLGVWSRPSCCSPLAGSGGHKLNGSRAKHLHLTLLLGCPHPVPALSARSIAAP